MDLASRAYWSSAVNAGLCRLAILKAVCERPGHGYALIRRISARTRGTFHPTEATIYPTLAELRKCGCVTRTTECIGRRERHVYAVTAKGLEACRAAAEAWRTGFRAVFRKPQHRRRPKRTAASR